MHKLRVAVAQINPKLGDVDANTEKHIEFVRAARKEDVDLLVFPELSLSGYNLKQTVWEVAIDYHDERLSEIANESGKMISIVGFIELGFAAQIHNTAVALRHGDPIYLHRKLNLPNYGMLDEGKLYTPGRHLETFHIQDPWHSSVLICSDVWNPALVHLSIVSGTTILLVPTNSAYFTVSSDFCNPTSWDMTLKFYSMMYGIPIIMANRIGEEEGYKFWGGSKILNPGGKIETVAKEGHEDLIISDFEYMDVVRARAKLPTVRDSNLDLMHREIGRLTDRIGYPKVFRRD